MIKGSGDRRSGGATVVLSGAAACAALLLCAQTAPAALVGHWKLDEGSGAASAVDSTGGTNGVVGSSLTTGVAGVAGGAYEFDGGFAQDDIVDMGNAASVFTPIFAGGGTAQITISAWFSWTDNTDHRRTGISVARTANNTQNIGLGVTGALGLNTRGGLYATAQNGTADHTVVNTTGFNDGGTLVDDGVIPENSGTALNDGQWHHVVLTVDGVGEVVTLYADGVSVGQDASPAVTFAAYNNLELGRLGRSSPAGGFIGKIDDVQIYSHILSASDVAYLFAHPGSPVPEPASLAVLGLGGLAALGRRRRGREPR